LKLSNGKQKQSINVQLTTEPTQTSSEDRYTYVGIDVVMKMQSAFALGCLTVGRGRAYSNKLFNCSKRIGFATKSTQKKASMEEDLKAALIMEITDSRMMLANDPIKLNNMIDNYYIPLYAYFQGQLMEHEVKHQDKTTKPPLFVGISAPQGCGKTTLTNIMKKMFSLTGKSCISMSLDDFYLTGEEQDKLAAENSDNPLLQFRGNAGTHDIPLLTSTMKSLRDINLPKSTAPVMIPHYDKSLRNGRGDRAPTSKFMKARSPVDIVLFEGWMLGFTPITVNVPLEEYWASSKGKREVVLE
jgi:pantothenate kinase-related protein Tda10